MENSRKPLNKNLDRCKYNSPQSHPWKLTSFKQYPHRNEKSHKDYLSEEDMCPQLQV